MYAYCRMRKDYRFFKLKRMQDMNVLEEIFERQAPKQVLQNENTYPVASKVKVKLKIEKEAAYRAMDDFTEYEILEDGSVLISGEFIQDEWLLSMLIGYGEYCEIVEPVWIREQVKEKLARTMEKYQ